MDNDCAAVGIGQNQGALSQINSELTTFTRTNILSGTRLEILDCIRGVTLVSMILYHAVWDLVFLFQMDWPWFRSTVAVIWQQSICWTFILLSGFCWSFSKNPMKRGLTVSIAGAAVTVVTLLFLPEQRVVFGILTLLGACILLMIPLKRRLERIPPSWGMASSFFLFAVMKNVGDGVFGLGSWISVQVPETFYHGWAAAFLGFPMDDFYSTDYFPLIPWFFLFLAGYFLHRIYVGAGGYSFLKRAFHSKIICLGIKPLNIIGRHSLSGYLVHQPVIFFCLSLFFLRNLFS